MTCNGRKGTWTISYQFLGNDHAPAVYPNSSSDDAPYFSNEGGRGILRSACDGRNMEPPYFAGSFDTVTITGTVFTPNPDKYDCINGNCVVNTQYTTPGIYDSIDSCNLSCGGPTCAAGLSCLDPNSLVCPVCPTCPTCPECPDCPDSEGICPPCGPCPTASSCPTGQTCQLPTGEDVNFVNIAAPIFLGTCDDSGNPVMGTRQVRVIEGTETSESLKFQDLAQIQGAAVCKVDVAAIPDGWLIRPEWHRSQVIYQFAQIDNSGKIVGAPKYKITVPHHLSDQPDDPLPNYKRGNWEIIYVLKDNSKVTIHSFDETTGMNLLDAIKLRIIPSYLDGSYLSKSGLVVTDTSIAEITVKNRMAKYYSTGTKNDLPDWIAKW